MGMFLGSLILFITVLAQAAVGTNPDKANETASTGQETTESSVSRPEPDQAQPGDVKDAVSRSLELFVPSEEIDVDKPVDFPTNI